MEENAWMHVDNIFSLIVTIQDPKNLKKLLIGAGANTLMYDHENGFFFKHLMTGENMYIKITIKNKEQLTTNLNKLKEINEKLKSPTFSVIIDNFELIKNHAQDKIGGKRSKKRSKKHTKKHHKKRSKKRRRTKKYLR